MKRQRGVALITAVLVVALASIAAAAMLASANLAIHRTTTLSNTERAWWYVDGVEAWVKTLLQADAQNSPTDHLGEAWAKTVDYIPVDEGGLRGGLTDLQGRFNLNNLGIKTPGEREKYLKQFQRLVQSLPLSQQVSTAGLAEAITDWIDPDIEPTDFVGAEDEEYSTLQPPYRTANRPMSSVSELLAVRGVTKELYLALRDYVAALPLTPGAQPGAATGTPINVNTAPELVLMSLSAQSPQGLTQFIQSRDKTPATSVGQFTSEAYGGTQPTDAPLLDVKSSFFRLRSEAFIGSSRIALYSVIYRQGSNVLPAVISRSQDYE
jgi:general secretion pathway protein K